MIETNLTNDDILKNEPSLKDHLLGGQVDFQSTINEAYNILFRDIKNQNIEVRKICIKLWLQETEKTATAETYASAISDLDNVERLRWVIVVSDISTGPTVFQLQGKDTKSSDWSTVNSVMVDKKGVHKFSVIDVKPNTDLHLYKYYRIYKKDATSTITFKSYLVEDSYENLHLWKTLSRIYMNLVLKGNDIFMDKAEYYEKMYQDYLVNNRYYYDSDGDGKISDSESKVDYNEVIIGRGS